MFAIGCNKSAQPVPDPVAEAERVSAAVAKADALLLERSDFAKLSEMVETLKALRDPDNRNFEVEWRFSRASYYFGRFTKDPTEQDKAWDEGRQAGRIASRLRPDRPDGFYWSGANLGEQSLKRIVTVGYEGRKELRGLMDEVIRIDASYEGGGAYVVLAQLELTTGLVGGKPSTAVEHLQKAVELGSTDPRTRLILAEAYLATGKVDKSKQQLDELFKMKPVKGTEAEYEAVLVRAKRMRQKRF